LDKHTKITSEEPILKKQMRI